MTVRLHRCGTPTDWLCPCGRVARALRAAGIDDVEVVREPRRRAERDGVRAASGQDRVPLVVFADGDAVCDSLRIVEAIRRRSQPGLSNLPDSR